MRYVELKISKYNLDFYRSGMQNISNEITISLKNVDAFDTKNGCYSKHTCVFKV